MKKSILFPLLFSLCTLLFVPLSAQETTLGLVPKPVEVKPMDATFTLPDTIQISIPDQSELSYVRSLLKDKLSKPTGKKVIVNSGSDADLVLTLNKKEVDKWGDEGYHLRVDEKGVKIEANQPAGLFYGTQTLLQLLPPEIEKDKLVTAPIDWEIPAVEITDYPRVAWRGLMFDVVRHFFTKEEVKHFIDDMVKYKYNLLHLHLTDDQGWRIEIKGYPKLTEEAAWRVNRMGYFGTFSAPGEDEPRDYGGFYTQEDIKEIVQYAKERFVDVMPEVDVPGHSMAAISAYPELACNPELASPYPDIGEPFIDWTQHATRVDNNLCPTKPEVYTFLDTVIGQLAELFPFEYIDMGGDETMYNFWEKNESIKKLMKKEGLKNLPEVQGYFTNRVEKMVNAHGKRLVGWDEILEGGVSPSATVMSWRGMDGGIKAAKLGHKVVMSPTTYAYLDYMQGDSIVEPHVYGQLNLKKSYEFNPVPEGVDPEAVLGGQANLWTEQIQNFRTVQYMIWPRALAVSEALWTPQEKREWNDFFNRVEYQFKRFEASDTKYAPSVYDPEFRIKKDKDGKLLVKLITEPHTIELHYSFDNSFPDQYYPKYKEPLSIPKEAVQLRVVTYKGDKKVGRMITMPIKELERRAGK